MENNQLFIQYVLLSGAGGFVWPHCLQVWIWVARRQVYNDIYGWIESGFCLLASFTVLLLYKMVVWGQTTGTTQWLAQQKHTTKPRGNYTHILPQYMWPTLSNKNKTSELGSTPLPAGCSGLVFSERQSQDTRMWGSVWSWLTRLTWVSKEDSVMRIELAHLVGTVWLKQR